MDLKICGILDIILLIGLIISLVFGYKKGFIKKAISLIGALAVLIFSIIYCGQFAQFMIDKGIIAPGIHDTVFKNATEAITNNLNGAEPTVENVLKIGLGLNDFVYFFVSKAIDDSSVVDPTLIPEAIATGATAITMRGISFMILFFGISIICLLTKLIATLLRKNIVIHVVDGALGACLYAAIYMLVVFAIFAILNIFYNQEWFIDARNWIDTDMGIVRDENGIVTGTNHFIGIARYVFNGNLLVSIFHLFF